MDDSPHGWGVWRFMEEVTEGVMEMEKKTELEVEPEVLTELLQFHGKTLTFEQLLLMDEHRKWFLVKML